MSWKPSKRQAQLKQRLIDSSRVYWSTSRTLNQMLLKMLHSNNVYTPDDLYDKYINQGYSGKKILPAKFKPRTQTDKHQDRHVTRQIDHALTNLDSALIQLKHVIDNRHSSIH